MKTQTKPHWFISIHALLAESDFYKNWIMRRAERFLSTLSLRRATRAAALENQRFVISIHALLAESDLVRPVWGIGIAISIHALLAESDITTLFNLGEL